MRTMTIAVMAAALGCCCTTASGQSPLDRPVGEWQVLARDSGPRSNVAARSARVFIDVVYVESAAWVRLEFGPTELGPGSFIKITSALDGEVQRLDAGTLAMWNDASAFFNGDTVIVELIAAPGTTDNVMRLEMALFETAAAGGAESGAEGSCGICGADDRVASFENWTGRLLPGNCTASVWNTQSCLVSAGHCMSGNNAIGFNVPPSDPGCVMVQPPVADQFPLVETSFTSGGLGNDWAVMRPGTNSLGQTIFERYGAMRPIAATPATVGQAASCWGYGLDDGAACYTQQTSSGTIVSAYSTFYQYDVDTTTGQSGSAIVVDDAIIAIATHCACPTNRGTRIDLPAFAAARDAICPPPPSCAEDCASGGDGMIDITDLLALLSEWNGPGACDADGSGTVTSADMLLVLAAWGGCGGGS